MRPNKIASSLIGLIAAGLLAACSQAPATPHVVLDHDLASLQSAFNADTGKVRAIFLASPVCGACLRGTSQLHEAWLKVDARSDVAVYVVWSPQLGAREGHVAGGASLIPDERARHYWDEEARVGVLFMPLLASSLGPDYAALAGAPAAWDVWMLFDPDARWTEAAPPAPVWWEHQLNVLPADRRLDPERFAARAMALEAVGETARTARVGDADSPSDAATQ